MKDETHSRTIHTPFTKNYFYECLTARNSFIFQNRIAILHSLVKHSRENSFTRHSLAIRIHFLNKQLTIRLFINKTVLVKFKPHIYNCILFENIHFSECLIV